MREVQDHYFREAKREGYLSRAAYKLIEIDDRRKILRPGDRVLDCGAAPGSWLQVAAKRVGPRGMVIGIDLQPIRRAFPEGNVRVIEGDVTEIDPIVLRAQTGGQLFDVVLSDMAPRTSGEHSADHFRSVRLCEAVLDRLPVLLRAGGAGAGGKLVMKVLEGEQYPELLRRTRAMFDAARGFKPKASRSESTEMYLIGEGFRPDVIAPSPETNAAEEAAPPKRSPRPSPGWR